ncbi:hypothetical protein G9P44_000322 [Scheffersomyces stipitis]|nr:hypothetical protein G9P44_000322 [Scheffersomyces stipitis]
MSEQKLTKKQRKALEFRSEKSKEERAEEKEEKKRAREKEESSKVEKEEKTKEEKTKEDKNKEETAEDDQPKKKRKTRRGKKGKGANGGKGPRFILFVGNLPYDIEQTELLSHFKNSNPDRIRLRQDKGIAFLEFDNDTQEIQSKMELALKMHHSTLRNRKINVELTVGGGGNSENRLNKLKEKNEKLLEERRAKVKEDIKKKSKEATSTAPASSASIHPSRAALIG